MQEHDIPPELARRMLEISPDRRAELERKLEQKLRSQGHLPPLTKRADTISLPLSFAQERLFFLWQLEPENPTYNRPAFLRVRGQLEVEKLEGALSELCRRHEVLRSVYTFAEGELGQRVLAPGRIALPLTDLSGLPKDQRHLETERLMRAAARKPFDLLHEPAIHVALLRLTAEEHLLLLVFHHIAFDAWSAAVLLRELSLLYGRSRNEDTPELEPLPLQYPDFAAWQRRCFENGMWQKGLAYWKEELSGELPPLDFPFPRGRTPPHSVDGETLSTSFSNASYQNLKAACLQFQVTPFMLLLAAYQVLLFRYTQLEGLVVGFPAAGRTQIETETLIGCFINTLALRTRLHSDMTFLEILSQVRDRVLLSLQHQDVPFEKIIEAVNPPRFTGRNPIFQTLFNYRNLPGPPTSRDTVQFETCPCPDVPPQFELVLDILANAGGLSLRWIFDPARFAREDMAGLAQQYGSLLEHLLAEPNRAIKEVRLSTQPEGPHLDSVPRAPERNEAPLIHELFRAQVERRPDATALVLENQRSTYRELNERANRLAHHLRTTGVGPRVLVAIYLDRSFDMLVAILGVLKAGGAYVPLDLNQPAARLAMILDEVRPVVLLTQEKLRGGLPASSGKVVALHADLPALPAESAGELAPLNKPDDPAYVIYTSGSSGRPKGVIVSHANVTRLFTQTAPWFRFNSSDVWALFHSYAFDFSVWEIFGALLYGGKLVIVPREVSRSAIDFHGLLVREQVTVLNQTPSAFRHLIHANVEGGGQHLGSLRYVLLGGEKLDFQILRPWFKRHGDEKPKVINMYGITETTVHVTYRRVRQADLEQKASLLGIPIPDLDLYLLDKHLQPVPAGLPGEICIAGPGVSRGYLNHPELTSERFVPDPFCRRERKIYRSGDLARRTAKGELEFLGRSDEQLKIRGFRVEPAEIESVLVRHPAVREAAVVVQERGKDRQHLTAFFTCRGEAGVSVDSLRTHVRAHLPDYMIPSAFVALPVMPLTANGKIARQTLRELNTEPAVTPRTRVSGTRTERALTGIWQEVLGRNHIGVHDNFFDLGGHSLLAMRLLWEIQKQLGKTLPLAALFATPTIAELATLIDSGQPMRATFPRNGLRGSGTGAPLFYIPGSTGYEFLPETIALRIEGIRPFYDGLEYPGLDGRHSPLERIEDIAAHLLSQIVEIAPQGPYCLAGYSVGGVVAYEIARQMEEQGLDIERLFLLDTYCPGHVVRSRSFQELLRAIRARLSPLSLGARLKWFARLFQIKLRVRGSMVIHRKNVWSRRLGFQKSNAGDETVSRVAAAALRGAGQYRPGIFHGRVLLFRAEYWDFAYFFRKRPELGGWGELLKGEVQLETIPGPHEFVLAEPSLSVLAEKMSACLKNSAPEENSRSEAAQAQIDRARLSFSGKPG